MSEEAQRVVDEIGGDWTLDRRLGGAQQGAWLLRAGVERAVLKWHAPDDVFCNDDVPAVVTYLREQHYPTPAWLDWGVLDNGARYWLQEFVDVRGDVHVVDIEAAARGCAASDLLSPVVNAVIWKSDPKAIDRLLQHAFATFDRYAVLTCAEAMVASAEAWYGSPQADPLRDWLATL